MLCRKNLKKLNHNLTIQNWHLLSTELKGGKVKIAEKVPSHIVKVQKPIFKRRTYLEMSRLIIRTLVTGVLFLDNSYRLAVSITKTTLRAWKPKLSAKLLSTSYSHYYVSPRDVTSHHVTFKKVVSRLIFIKVNTKRGWEEVHKIMYW